MHPANHDLAVQVREQGIRQAVQQSRSRAQSSPQAPNRVRSLQSEESWIDISSRNSTSSLSSAGGGEDTLTPNRGLDSTAFQRRRRLQRSYSGQTHYSNVTHATMVTDSSQEEYEESESEQDQVLMSSNDDLQRTDDVGTAQTRRSMRRVPSSSDSSDAPYLTSSNEGTALTGSRPSDSRLAASFRPQPNAFTHPPQYRAMNSYQPEPTNHFSATAPMTRAVSANAAYPPLAPQNSGSTFSPGSRAPSNEYSNARNRSHTPYNMISPSHNVSVDHDAALRASLSTLLSCAAARRGVPKRDGPIAPTLPPAGQQIARGTLCLIPESELDGPKEPRSVVRVEERPIVLSSPVPVQASAPRSRSPRHRSKSKSPSRSLNGRRRRAVAFTTISSIADLDSSSLSPTALWFLGVGALFLGGAVLFTAGYIQGKEVGYVEGLSDAGAVSCRGEVAVDGLRGMSRRGWRSATAGASIWGIS